MVDGVVLLEIPDELAWSLWLEDQDIGELGRSLLGTRATSLLMLIT